MARNDASSPSWTGAQRSANHRATTCLGCPDAIRAGEDTVTMLATLPREPTGIVTRLRAGRLEIPTETEGYARAELERARSANRVALS